MFHHTVLPVYAPPGHSSHPLPRLHLTSIFSHGLHSSTENQPSSPCMHLQVPSLKVKSRAILFQVFSELSARSLHSLDRPLVPMIISFLSALLHILSQSAILIFFANISLILAILHFTISIPQCQWSIAFGVDTGKWSSFFRNLSWKLCSSFICASVIPIQLSQLNVSPLVPPSVSPLVSAS